MPLSRDLRVLSTWFQEVMDGRAEFTALGARNFRDALDRAAWNAKAIEEGEAGDSDPKPDPLGCNIVAFRPVCTLRRVPINDGDAA